jgi:hypothetical protein
MDDIGAIEERIRNLREWLKKEAPECFAEQKHTEEGTQERIYWHHGYMMGLRDALQLFIGESHPSRSTHTQGKPTTNFSA